MDYMTQSQCFNHH